MIKDLDSTDLEAFFEAIPIRMTILDSNNNIQAMNTEAWSRVKVNVRDREGNFLGTLHLMYDISEEFRLRRKLEELKAKV